MTVSEIDANRLLRLVPREVLEDVLEATTSVALAFKEPIYPQGKPMEFVYFPIGAVVSLVVDLEEGQTVEAGTIGSEGMVGIGLFLGSSISPWRAICQIAGGALRLKARDFVGFAQRSDTFARVLLRYTNALVGTLTQTAVCNRAHPVEARMCRWLLMTRDRVDSDDFPLTQEFLGQMLGVRRPAVSLAGHALQSAGLIRYSKGRIRIVDRAGLESASCECYRVVRDLYEGALALRV